MSKKTIIEVEQLGQNLDKLVAKLEQAVKTFDDLQAISGLQDLSDFMKKLGMNSKEVQTVIESLRKKVDELAGEVADVSQMQEEQKLIYETIKNELTGMIKAVQENVQEQIKGVQQAQTQASIKEKELETQKEITKEVKAQTEAQKKEAQPKKPPVKKKQPKELSEIDKEAELKQEIEKTESNINRLIMEQADVIRDIHTLKDKIKEKGLETQALEIKSKEEIQRLQGELNDLESGTLEYSQKKLELHTAIRESLEDILKISRDIDDTTKKTAEKKPEAVKEKVGKEKPAQEEKVTEEPSKKILEYQAEVERQKTEQLKDQAKIQELLNKLKHRYLDLSEQAYRLGMPKEELDRIQEYYEVSRAIIQDEDKASILYDQKAIRQAELKNEIKEQLKLAQQLAQEKQKDLEADAVNRERERTEQIRERLALEKQSQAIEKQIQPMVVKAEGVGLDPAQISQFQEYRKVAEELKQSEEMSLDIYREKVHLQQQLKAEINEIINARKQEATEAGKVIEKQEKAVETTRRFKEELREQFRTLVEMPVDVEELSKEYPKINELLETQKSLKEEIKTLSAEEQKFAELSYSTQKELDAAIKGVKDRYEEASEEIKNQQNTIYDIFRLEQERKNNLEIMEEAGFGEEALNKTNVLYKDLIRKASEWSNENRKSNVEIERSSKEWEQVRVNVSEAKRVISRTTKHIAYMGRATRGFSEVLREAFRDAFTLEKVANRIAFVITAKLSYDAFKYFHRGLREGIRLAIQFEDTMARVFSLMAEQATPTLRTHYIDSAREAMVRYGQSIETTNRALYDIVSAQIDVNQATQVLNTTMRLAVAEFTDVKIATDAVTTTLNAYNMEAERAVDVSDLLTTIITQGKTTLEELAPVWGRVAAVGGMFALDIDDIAASLAVMTRSGLSASEATTSLRQLLLTITQPSEKAKEVMEMYGISMDVATLRAEGLAGVAQRLMGLQEEHIVTLASSRRGIMALATAMSDTEGYTRTYEAMLNRTGATQEKFEELSETTAFKMEQMKSQMADMALTLGNAVVPFLASGAEALSTFGAGAEFLLNAITELRLQYILFAAVLAKLTPMILANPYLAIAAGVAVGVTAIGTLIRRHDEYRKRVQELREERIAELRAETQQMQLRREQILRLKQLEAQTNRTAKEEAEYVAIKENLGKAFEDTNDLLKTAAEELSKIDIREAEAAYNILLEQTYQAVDEFVTAEKQIITTWDNIRRYMHDFAKEMDKWRQPVWDIFDETPYTSLFELTGIYVELEREMDSFTLSVRRGTMRAAEAQEELIALQSEYQKQAEELYDIMRKSDKERTRQNIKQLDEYNKIIGLFQERIDALGTQIASEKELDAILDRRSRAEAIGLSLLREQQEISIRGIRLSKEQWKEAGKFLDEFQEGLEENKVLQELIRRTETATTEERESAYNALFGYIDEYIRKTKEADDTGDDGDRIAKINKEWQKRLQALKDGIDLEHEWLKLIRSEEIETKKVVRQYDELIEELEKVKDFELPVGMREDIEDHALTLLRLQRARLQAQLAYNKAQEDLNKILARQRIAEEARDLGVEFDIAMPSVDEIREAYETLIETARNANEDITELQWQMNRALDQAYLNQLSDLERYVELRNRTLAQQARLDAIQYMVGQRELEKHGYSMNHLMGANLQELEDILKRTDLTDEMRKVLEGIIETRQFHEQREAWAKEFAEFEQQVMQDIIDSPIPTALSQMFVPRKSLELLKKQHAEAKDDEAKQAELMTQIQQAQLQSRVESEQYIANQLRDIWNSYLQARQQQIQKEYDEAVKSVQKRHKLEFRSQVWLDSEMEKLDEKRAKEERKLKRQQQRMMLAEAAINIATAITKAISGLQWWAIPVISALGAIQMGIIASQKFAKGGYTGRAGTVKRDETGEKPVGIVHEEEFVFSKKATRGNVGLLYTLHDILSGKTSHSVSLRPKTHFAEGGYTGKSPMEIPDIALRVDGVEKRLDKLIDVTQENRIVIKTKTITPVEVSKLADRGRSQRGRGSL